MFPRLSLMLLLPVLALPVVPASARLGDTLGDLKKRFGSPETQMQPRRDSAYWLFEGEDGQLLYTVTFDAKGRSIAEGLKPVKRARFTKDVAMDFIDSQIAPVRDSKSLRVLKTGDAYTFAGQNFVCGKDEYVVVDEPLGLLVIWNRAGVPNVMVVGPEIMRRTN